MEIRTATDTGLVRENNEDSFWVSSRILVVCDGMGGHVAGEVASSLATEVIKSFPFTGKDPKGEVLSAVHQAQERILAEGKNNEAYHGMGSTITLAALSEPDETGNVVLTVGHVGDSRCYVFSRGSLEQITSDHSVVAELLRSETITAEEARTHPKKHILTQVLGAAEIEVELVTRTLAPGALLMLCTDGLTDLVDDSLIEETLRQDFYSSNLAQDLVDLANQSGGVDNITVIVARI